ncbi:PREDICTED: UPF0711 protein C18orf21 homolog [Nanorana parkeri]|uniref:UPF0711 protein C18orf21 homolog n=1 Tax=Nanorana parkeri TaxID=125878 RepID=UPI000854CBB0|nr:PREDICTED: UPF0711 protein C18orf21 homolog [Nanorana parkeri]
MTGAGDVSVTGVSRGTETMAGDEPASMEGMLRQSHCPLPKKVTSKKKGICPFCFQLFTPDNRKVRLRPKIKITPRIELLLRKEAKSHRLNLKHTKLLRKYKCSRSVLVVTCNTCKMVSKYPGEGRNGLTSGPSTPKTKRNFGSPDLRTPGSSRKVNMSYSEEKLSSKSKSPVLTPRSCVSAHSSPATMAKSTKKGKFKFSRLKMLLSQDEKTPSKKGDLQNFLTSLA